MTAKLCLASFVKCSVCCWLSIKVVSSLKGRIRAAPPGGWELASVPRGFRGQVVRLLPQRQKSPRLSGFLTASNRALSSCLPGPLNSLPWDLLLARLPSWILLAVLPHAPGCPPLQTAGLLLGYHLTGPGLAGPPSSPRFLRAGHLDKSALGSPGARWH